MVFRMELTCSENADTLDTILFSFHYLSQFCSHLPKTAIRNSSNKKNNVYSNLKNIEKIYRDVGGYHKNYNDFNGLCRKSREDEFSYRCID